MPNLQPKIGNHRVTDPDLRELLTKLLRRTTESRAEVADKLSVYAGQRISKRMLDDWTAQSKKPARFPAFLVHGLCEVLGDDQLQRYLLSDRLRGLLAIGESVELLLTKVPTQGKKR